MPRGGKRENSGRKRRDPTDPIHLWIVERIRHHLKVGDKLRNTLWKRKYLKSKAFNDMADANEHYAEIDRLNAVRNCLVIDLEKVCTERGVSQLTELEHPRVRELKHVENELANERANLKDAFENDIAGGGLVTPIPAPSHKDMSYAYKSVAAESTNVLVKKVTVREVKEAWAAFQRYEGQFKKVD